MQTPLTHTADALDADLHTVSQQVSKSTLPLLNVMLSTTTYLRKKELKRLFKY